MNLPYCTPEIAARLSRPRPGDLPETAEAYVIPAVYEIGANTADADTIAYEIGAELRALSGPLDYLNPLPVPLLDPPAGEYAPEHEFIRAAFRASLESAEARAEARGEADGPAGAYVLRPDVRAAAARRAAEIVATLFGTAIYPSTD